MSEVCCRCRWQRLKLITLLNGPFTLGSSSWQKGLVICNTSTVPFVFMYTELLFRQLSKHLKTAHNSCLPPSLISDTSISFHYSNVLLPSWSLPLDTLDKFIPFTNMESRVE